MFFKRVICNNNWLFKCFSYTESSFYTDLNVNNIDEFETIQTEQKDWTVNCRIAQCHLHLLLGIFKKCKGFEKLPKDSRTIFQTPIFKTDQIRLVNPNGKYFHFGLTNSLLKYYSKVNIFPNVIELVISIDGLPIARDSNSQFWPILAC